MRRWSPLFIFTLSLLSLFQVAEAHSFSDDRPTRGLIYVCDPTGHADLKRLEIHQQEFTGLLYFVEVREDDKITQLPGLFNSGALLNNKMPSISQDRAVERVVNPDNSVHWMIGGQNATCVSGDVYVNSLFEVHDDSIIVECTAPFLDLVKIEIREELDLPGDFFLVEYFADGHKNTIIDYFGKSALKPEPDKDEQDQKKPKIPRLTKWENYERTLHRASNKVWYIETKDECKTDWVTVSCKTYFY